MGMGERISAGWRRFRQKLFGKKRTAEETEITPLTVTADYVPPTPEMSRTTEEYAAWVEGRGVSRGFGDGTEIPETEVPETPEEAPEFPEAEAQEVPETDTPEGAAADAVGTAE